MFEVVKVRDGQIVKAFPFKGSIHQAVVSMIGAMKANKDHQELVLREDEEKEVLKVVRKEGTIIRVEIKADALLKLLRPSRRKAT